MTDKSFYDILEIPETSTQEEIKKSYRKLSLLNHPDKTNNDEIKTIKFKKINEAYNTLSDENLKSEYDSTLQYKRNTHTNANTNGMGMFHNTSGINPEDIIAQLFMNGVMGGMGGGRIHIKTFNAKPVCIIKKILITLQLAYSGGSCPIEIERVIIENNIQTNEKETVYITLDRGIDNDEMIILQGKGNVVNNIKGDVKVIVEIQNTSEYTRQGLDLTLTKKITLKESLVGFNFLIHHISGNMYNINNTKGNIIAPYYNKKIPGMGMTRGDFTGDLIIHFEVMFPTSLEMHVIDKLIEIL